MSLPTHSLEITTRADCPVDCSYCPQDRFIADFRTRSGVKIMTFETFKTCVDKLPNSASLIFSGYCEPFLNEECTRMILHANERGFPVVVFTTSLGLAEADIIAMKGVPFKRFVVHLPDDKNLTRLTPDERYFSVLSAIIRHIPRTNFVFMRRPGGDEDLHPAVKRFFRDERIPVVEHTAHSRGGNLKMAGIEPRRLKGKLRRCPRTTINVLLPNGDVTLCCMDFAQKHLIGNLLSDSYRSLFQSKEYLKVLEGLEDDSSDILCRQCAAASRANVFLRIQDLVFYKLPHRIKDRFRSLVRRVTDTNETR